MTDRPQGYYNELIAAMKEYFREGLYKLDYKEDVNEYTYYQEILKTVKRFEQTPTDEDELIILSEMVRKIKEDIAEKPEASLEVDLRNGRGLIQMLVSKHGEEWGNRVIDEFTVRHEQRIAKISNDLGRSWSSQRTQY